MPADTQPAPTSGTAPLLEARSITKRYPGVVANHNVNISVERGSVHCLLGENGAGKSTLGNVLYGLTRPDSGAVFIDGEEQRINRPIDAIRAGIGMVHQDFMLVRNLTVAENIKLGLPSPNGLVDLSEVRDRLGDLAATYGLSVEPDAYIWELSVGQQQRVELLKALYRNARLLILDEPTSALGPADVEALLGTFEALTSDGAGLIFITHKIAEVFVVGDAITVLRDGEVVDRTHTSRTDADQLAQTMVGRPIAARRNVSPVRAGRPFLEIENLVVRGDRGNVRVNGVSLEVRSGEIVGVAGVAGSGQRELTEAILGARKADSGTLRVLGEEVIRPNPKRMRARGVALVPEDRNQSGVIVDFTVGENLTMVDYNEPVYRRHGWIDRLIQRFNPAHTPARTRFGLRDRETVEIRAIDLMGDFSIRAPSADTPVHSLSGGNVQRVVLAREFSSDASVMVISSPTRGLDVAATAYIHGRLLMQREEGRAVLLLSEDLDELLALADRILVMFNGNIVGEVSRSEATAENVGALMAGIGAGAPPTDPAG